MGVAAGDRAQYAERRGDGVASALDGQPDDVFRVEIERIGRERGACRVFDALIDGQDRDISRSAQPPVVEDAAQGHERGNTAVGGDPQLVDSLWRGSVDQRFVDRLAGMSQVIFPVGSQQFFDVFRFHAVRFFVFVSAGYRNIFSANLLCSAGFFRERSLRVMGRRHAVTFGGRRFRFCPDVCLRVTDRPFFRTRSEPAYGLARFLR